VEIVAEVHLHLPESEGAQAAKACEVQAFEELSFVETAHDLDASGIIFATLYNTAKPPTSTHVLGNAASASMDCINVIWSMAIPFEWTDFTIWTRLKLGLPQKRLMLTPTRELERVAM